MDKEIRNMFKNFKMLPPDKIKEELAIWEAEWKLRKSLNPNARVIDAKLKQLKCALNKIEIPTSNILMCTLTANNLYNELEYLSKVKKIGYEIELMTNPVSDFIKIFKKHESTFDDKKYWKELANVYILQNYKKIPYSTFYKLFSAKRKYRDVLMTEEEKKILTALPDYITIYRGGSVDEEVSKKYGISWTLNRKIAKNFQKVKAIRDKKVMKVFAMKIHKSQVIAYFNQREEDEIIYIHKHK